MDQFLMLYFLRLRVVFSHLAVKHKALNLGQGFPDFFPPQYVRDALTEAVQSDDPFMNQYTRSYVSLPDRQQVSDSSSVIK